MSSRVRDASLSISLSASSGNPVAALNPADRTRVIRSCRQAPRIRSGVHNATLAIFVDDRSEGKADTRAFLDRRIDGIIRFEKAKAQLLKPGEDRFSLARFLGRLRYPAN